MTALTTGTDGSLKGLVVPWVMPILGNDLLGATASDRDQAIEEVEVRALHLLNSIDPLLAGEFLQGLRAARWLLPLLVFRLPEVSRLSLRLRALALDRCVNPPLLLRPFGTQLRGIARALKLLVVFPYFTQEAARTAIGYVAMDDRPRTLVLDLSPRRYPLPDTQ